MKQNNINRTKQRQLRHRRTLNKLHQLENTKPRLVVTRSNQHISCQLIDDAKGITLCASSTLTLDLNSNNKANAAKVGTDIANKAKKLNITEVVFDRGGNKYHGKIAALADAAREAGLKF